MATEGPSAERYLSEEMIQDLSKQFMKALKCVIDEFKAYKPSDDSIEPSQVTISQSEMKAAFREAENDLQFMLQRRQFSSEDIQKNGVAAGKIAGMVAFRLLRHRIVHIANSKNRNVGRLQELAVIRLVSDAILRIRPDQSPFTKNIGGTEKPWLLHELLYLIARRHFNQETLALIFETAVNMATIPTQPYRPHG